MLCSVLRQGDAICPRLTPAASSNPSKSTAEAARTACDLGAFDDPSPELDCARKIGAVRCSGQYLVSFERGRCRPTPCFRCRYLPQTRLPILLSWKVPLTCHASAAAIRIDEFTACVGVAAGARPWKVRSCCCACTVLSRSVRLDADHRDFRGQDRRAALEPDRRCGPRSAPRQVHIHLSHSSEQIAVHRGSPSQLWHRRYRWC